MNCYLCGKHLPNKSIEGADFQKDSCKNWWCVECVRHALNQYPELIECRDMAEQANRYREGLLTILPDYIKEGYCVNPRDKSCRPSPEKCLKCWFKHLTGEEMEG
jgi:hypothetical protein